MPKKALGTFSNPNNHSGVSGKENPTHCLSNGGLWWLCIKMFKKQKTKYLHTAEVVLSNSPEDLTVQFDETLTFDFDNSNTMFLAQKIQCSFLNMSCIHVGSREYRKSVHMPAHMAAISFHNIGIGWSYFHLWNCRMVMWITKCHQSLLWHSCE